jgi:acyl-coenzyme A thioesterase PaaI-like protein
VTAEMTIRYRSPAAPGEELLAEARVVERRRRIYEVAGEVRGPDGRLIAEATGRYLGATPSERAELKARYGIGPGVGGE